MRSDPLQWQEALLYQEYEVAPIDVTIDGLRFLQTCIACPEQYDVFVEDGELVGYVRLRHGRLRAEYVEGSHERSNRETILEHLFNLDDARFDHLGVFPDDTTRDDFLRRIARKLNERKGRTK